MQFLSTATLVTFHSHNCHLKSIISLIEIKDIPLTIL